MRKAGKSRHHGLARKGLKNKMGLGRLELSTGHSYGVKKPHQPRGQSKTSKLRIAPDISVSIFFTNPFFRRHLTHFFAATVADSKERTRE